MVTWYRTGAPIDVVVFLLLLLLVSDVKKKNEWIRLRNKRGEESV